MAYDRKFRPSNKTFIFVKVGLERLLFNEVIVNPREKWNFIVEHDAHCHLLELELVYLVDIQLDKI